MPEPNEHLRSARERTPSRLAPGECASRAEIADAVNHWLWQSTRSRRYQLDAHYLAKLERGVVRWPNATYRAGLRHVLNAESDSALGFRRPVRSGRTALSVGLEPVLAVTAADFLERLTVCSPVPSQVGWTDVQQVRSTTAALASSENLFGGGLSCEAATGQLRWATRLLGASSDTEVRNALHEAVGNLAEVVAFSAFDIGAHELAANSFRFALWCAEEGGSWQLRSTTLADMSRQAVYLGKLDEARSLIEYATVRMDRISATGRAMLETMRARVHARLGDYPEARSCVARADEQFAARRAEEDPPWLVYYDEAEHQGSTARALTPQALAERDPEPVAARLNNAIHLHSEDYPRSRAFSMIRLATLGMAVGDLAQAVADGRAACEAASGLHSQRTAAELRTLHVAAGRHAGIPAVESLREHIVEVLAGR